MTLLDLKLKLLTIWDKAKKEETTWFAIALGSVETIHAQWGELTENLPNWHWLGRAEHIAFAILGFLVCYIRFRKILAEVAKDL